MHLGDEFLVLVDQGPEMAAFYLALQVEVDQLLGLNGDWSIFAYVESKDPEYFVPHFDF